MDLFGFFHFPLGNKVLWKMEQSNENENETITKELTMEERFEDYPSLQIKFKKFPKTR